MRSRSEAPGLLGSNEHRAEERFEIVDMRMRSQEAVPVDHRLRQSGSGCRCMHRRKFRCGGTEGPRNLFVFFGLARTRRVDEAAAGCDGLSRVSQHGQLRRRKHRKVLFAPAPSNIRIAAQRSESRAWGVDKHAIEWTSERKFLAQICLDEPDVVGAACFDRPPEQFHPSIAHVTGNQQPASPHACRESRRFATRGRTSIEDPLTGARVREQ